MTDRIRLTMAMDVFVDDEQAMREAAFENLRHSWSSEDDFPYSSASDVPLNQAINSVLAQALPLDLPGCRRGALEVESGEATSVETTDDDEAPRDADKGPESKDDTEETVRRDADEPEAPASTGSQERPEEPAST
jgi:hypothetical protein